MRFTKEQRATIKTRLNAHAKYDNDRFGKSDTSVNYEEYLELAIEQELKCWYSGKPLSVNGESKAREASLDRIDCGLPHTKENTVLCHRALNLGRSDVPYYEWLAYLQEMSVLCQEREQELYRHLLEVTESCVC